MHMNNITIKLVKDARTYRSPLSLKVNSTVSFAIYLINSMEVEAAGVTDEYNRCIGFVTGDDLIQHIYSKRFSNEKIFIGSIMRPPNMGIYWDDSISKAINIMNYHQIDWLPIIHEHSYKFEALLYRGNVVNIQNNILQFSRKNINYNNFMAVKI